MQVSGIPHGHEVPYWKEWHTARLAAQALIMTCSHLPDACRVGSPPCKLLQEIS